ncbi:MAG: hypothetical protein KJ747_08900, partial [Actinobacteria bacterium]|nr:hypothetical protein [Actinomycetota bacterium]
MHAETIQAVVFGRYAEYRVDFEFENDSDETTKVLLGFPFLLPDRETPGYMPAAGFRAWQDGTPLAIEYVEGADGPLGVGYYTHEVTFRPGTTRVAVSYLASPSETVATPVDATAPAPWTSVEQHSLCNLSYWVHTGALWKGDIGTTILRYRFAPDAPAWGTAQLLAQRSQSLGEYAETMQDPHQGEVASVLDTVRQPEPGVFEWRFENYDPIADPKTGLSAYDVSLPYYRPLFGTLSRGSSTYPLHAIRASSELVLGEHSYPAVQALDGRPDTAWAEAASGDGAGESIKVEFDAPTNVAELRIVSGYAKTRELFRKYNRPKTLKVKFADGTSKLLDLDDQPGLQRFPLAASGATAATIEIVDVYHGTTRNETYISEIQFGTASAPSFASFEELMSRKVSAPIATEPTETTTSKTSTAVAFTGLGSGAASRGGLSSGVITLIGALVLGGLAGGAWMISR